MQVGNESPRSEGFVFGGKSSLYTPYMGHCKFCSCTVTKTKADSEARDYVAIDNCNVGDLYDKLSSCTTGHNDEELYKQVHVNSEEQVNKFDSKMLSSVLVYLQTYLVLMIMLCKLTNVGMLKLAKGSQFQLPVTSSLHIPSQILSLYFRHQFLYCKVL